jgi:ribose transport system substrate-binding protein
MGHRVAPRAFAGAAFVMLVLILSACGSGGSSSGSTAGESSSSEGSAATQNIPYNGPEASLPGSYPEPSGQPKAGFRVGYLNANASIPALLATQDGAEKVIVEDGGTLIGEDAQFEVQKQVSEFNNLIAQHVDAIIVYPLDPKALAPSLAQAKSAGIPVIGEDQPPNAELPPTENITASVLIGRDYAAYSLAKAIAEAKPGASFAILGNAAPVEALQYTSERQQYWGEKFGLEYLGRADTQADTPAGAAAAMSGIVGKYPEVEAVMAYNDPSAQSAASVAASSGKSGILITGFNGEKAALEQIAAGQLFATFAIPFAEVGEQMGIAAVDELTNTGLPLKPRTNVKGEIVTEKNAKSVEGV